MCIAELPEAEFFCRLSLPRFIGEHPENRDFKTRFLLSAFPISEPMYASLLSDHNEMSIEPRNLDYIRWRERVGVEPTYPLAWASWF